jgi:hypothetical protein
MKSYYALSRFEFERSLDRTLSSSFPASDPPPWTLGVPADEDYFSAAPAVAIPAAIDVVMEDGYRFGGMPVAGLAEAFALAATVPVMILIAGLPVVALIWAVTRAIAWLGGIG